MFRMLHLNVERGKGAFLSIPFNTRREDAIRTKVFETYIRTLRQLAGVCSQGGFNIKLEDIIFVTGCDLTSSWAMATFMNTPWDAEMSLSVHPVAGAASAWFQWVAQNQPIIMSQIRCAARSDAVYALTLKIERVTYTMRVH
jgi:hypothetical protein